MSSASPIRPQKFDEAFPVLNSIRFGSLNKNKVEKFLKNNFLFIQKMCSCLHFKSTFPIIKCNCLGLPTSITAPVLKTNKKLNNFFRIKSRQTDQIIAD